MGIWGRVNLGQEFRTPPGTAAVSEEKIAEAVGRLFDCRPRAVVEQLNLLRPIYAPTAAYGHFGREEESFTWERSDRIEALKDAVR